MPVSFDRHIVVMGVTGCGKSTVARALSEQLDACYLEGDDFHPAENKKKMNGGTPLSDDDRWPWLAALAKAMRESNDQAITVVSCSALKKSYREFITQHAGSNVLFIFLRGERATLAQRLGARENHFMDAGLLDSQLATLEPPDAAENALCLSIDNSVDRIVTGVMQSIPYKE